MVRQGSESRVRVVVDGVIQRRSCQVFVPAGVSENVYCCDDLQVGGRKLTCHILLDDRWLLGFLLCLACKRTVHTACARRRRLARKHAQGTLKPVPARHNAESTVPRELTVWSSNVDGRLYCLEHTGTLLITSRFSYPNHSVALVSNKVRGRSL